MNDGNRGAWGANVQIKLVTPEELADWLKVPLSWIYDRTRNSGPDKIPHYKLGRYLRFSITEIENYLRVRSAPFSLITKENVKDAESEFVKV